MVSSNLARPRLHLDPLRGPALQILRVAAPVAKGTGDASQDTKQKALHPQGRFGEVQHVAELPGEDRRLQEGGHALRVRLALLRQAEQVDGHLLEAGAWPDLDPDVRLLLAGIPPVVRRAGRHVQPFSGLSYRLVPVDTESHPPAQHREVLVYGRMHVLSRDGAAWPDVPIDRQQVASEILGADTDHHPLSGSRVLDQVSRLAHHILLTRCPTAIPDPSSEPA